MDACTLRSTPSCFASSVARSVTFFVKTTLPPRVISSIRCVPKMRKTFIHCERARSHKRWRSAESGRHACITLYVVWTWVSTLANCGVTSSGRVISCSQPTLYLVQYDLAWKEA